MFRHGFAALNASPEPKKKTKGKQIVKEPVKTTPVINSPIQSTSAGASSQNRNGASKVGSSAGASFQNPSGNAKVAKISSSIDVSSDDDCDVISSDDDCDDQPAAPSSLLNLLIAQVILSLCIF